MKTRSVTIAKLRRDYWGRIQRGGKRFEIGTSPSASSVAFVFKMRTRATIWGVRVSTPYDFGGYDASPWNGPC